MDLYYLPEATENALGRNQNANSISVCWTDANMTEQRQFLIYHSEDGHTKINMTPDAETLWLSQKQLTDLFGKAKGTISEHIKHIFEDGELSPTTTVRLFRTTAADGKQFLSRTFVVGGV